MNKFKLWWLKHQYRQAYEDYRVLLDATCRLESKLKELKPELQKHLDKVEQFERELGSQPC